MIPALAAVCVASGLFVALLVALWPHKSDWDPNITPSVYDPGIVGYDEQGPIPGPPRPLDSGNPIR